MSEKIIFIACPMTPMGGGMFRVADYLLQSQAPEGVPEAQRARLVAMETRGAGSALWSLVVVTGALLRLVRTRLAGRLAGVHINMAERLSLVRKGVLVVGARLLGVPVLLHLHAAQLHRFYPDLPAPARMLLRAVFGLASRVIVLGDSARGFVIDELKVPAERVDVVINGVPAPSVPRAPLSVSGGKTRVLFLGNLSERKGVGDLLAALQRSEQVQAGRVDVVFVGGGDVPAYQAKAKAMGLEGCASFAGWADQAQAAQWMATADVLVLPSYDEGLPLVILEALANGVPVICTPVGEIGNTLTNGEHAVFVHPGDVPGLTAVLDSLLGDPPQRQQLAAQGQALYARLFSLPKFADTVARLHQEVFGARTR